MANSKAIAISEDRALELSFIDDYAKSAATGGMIMGQLLKFDKGDWLVGKNPDDFDTNTKLIFCIDSMLIGWQLWENKRVVDTDIGLLVRGHQKKQRSELSLWGKEEEKLWPRDDKTGEPSDPWSFVNVLPFRETGKDGEYFTYITSSKGGLSAVGKFLVKVAEHMRQAPDEYPVVTLGDEFYKHPKFGKVYTPTFKIHEWVPKEDFGTPTPRADDDEPAEPAKAPKKGGGTYNKRQLTY